MKTYLSTYNYQMLKILKEEKHIMATNSSTMFYTVLTFKGKVFAKGSASQGGTGAMHIRNPIILADFLTRVENQQMS